MLFLDLSKPFDKVVRETLIEMRSGEINIEAHLVGLGLTQAAARHMATSISESGGLLRELGVPDAIAELVADLRDGAWFHHTSSGRTIVTRKGTRQGC